MKKRVLSIFLAFILVLSQLVFVTAAETTSITRGELTAIINKAFGYTQKSEENFVDARGNKYETDLAIAKKQGYINGNDKGAVQPDGELTFPELSVIALKLLEWDSEAAPVNLIQSNVPEWSKRPISVLKELNLLPEDFDYTRQEVSKQAAVAIVNKIKNATDIPYENPYRVKPYRLEDNFYQYINREYLANAAFYYSSPMESSFLKLSRETDKQVKQIIINAVKNQNSYEKDSDEWKMAEAYRIYTDKKTRNSLGISPLMPYIDNIMSAKTKDELMDILIQSKLDMYPFAAIGVNENINDTTQYAVYVDEYYLGLGAKSYYLEAGNEKIVAEYKKLLEKSFAYMKLDKAPERAAKLFEFEKKLAAAKYSPEEATDIVKLNNVMTLEGLDKKAPDLQLGRYIESAKYHTAKTYILSNPKALEFMNKLFLESSLDELKDYCAALVFLMNAGLLSEEIGKVGKELDDAIMGSSRNLSLEEKASDYVQTVFPDVVSKLYVEKYFSEQAKKDVIKMVKNEIAVFKKRIQANEWLSDTAKKYAVEKLSAMNIKMGYPDKWENYDGLTVDSKKDNLISQSIKNLDFYIEKSAKRINSPVDKNEWGMLPTDINAYNSLVSNEIVFPAALLQYPFYSLEMSEEENMGAIGVVIAHEITHAFDDNGSLFDKNGNLSNWWTDQDKKTFAQLGNKLAKQYDKYELMPKMPINGNLTKSESISDLGGILCALDVVGSLKEPNYKAFFQSFARIWEMKINNETLKYMNQFDTHPAGIARVNQTLKNVDMFYRVYGIQKGDEMYLDQEDRVTIW